MYGSQFYVEKLTIHSFLSNLINSKLLNSWIKGRGKFLWFEIQLLFMYIKERNNIRTRKKSDLICDTVWLW